MVAKPVHTSAAAPGKAGKPWSEDEEQRQLVGSDAGTPVAALTLAHVRSSGAITSRLLQLCRLQLP